MQLRSEKRTTLQQKEHLANYRTFAIETAFSANKIIELMEQAKEKG